MWTGPLLLEPEAEQAGEERPKEGSPGLSPWVLGDSASRNMKGLGSDKEPEPALSLQPERNQERIQVLSHFLLQSHSNPLPFVVIFMSLAAALG